MKRRFTRAQRAQLRKPFPFRAPKVSSMDFATLAEWEDECGRQAMVTSAFTLSGVRWRIARQRAHWEWFRRITTHVGPTPGLCDYCQTRPATVHTASGSRAAPRFEHTCAECDSQATNGWMSIAFAIQERPK